MKLCLVAEVVFDLRLIKTIVLVVEEEPRDSGDGGDASSPNVYAEKVCIRNGHREEVEVIPIMRLYFCYC